MSKYSNMYRKKKACTVSFYVHNIPDVRLIKYMTQWNMTTSVIFLRIFSCLVIACHSSNCETM